MRIVILGAGGHADVVADILMVSQSGNAFELVGFLDDDVQLHGVAKTHARVLGSISNLSRIEHDGVAIAIGNNRVRSMLYAHMKDLRETVISAVHPSATISPHAKLAHGVIVCAGVIVGIGAVVGPNVILNTACSVDHHNFIGVHAHIGPGVRLGGHVTVGEGALVGIGAVVMPQRFVGEWSIVGAGALVNRDVVAGTTVIGVPARLLES